MNKKVFVGISGGVDSSVSAAILKDQGYDVTGVFIKAWYPDFLNCDWKEEKRDAMRVCTSLGIPFKMLDLSKEYKEEVIDYMVDEYKRGNTPNPDVMCNKYIKFGSFFDWAIKQGADYIATGHYAQVEEVNGKFFLKKSLDTEKDQTYFIWNLNQEHLKHSLFPIGKYKKEKVRKLAKKYGLFTDIKKDSQGLCFLGQLDMKTFLKEFVDTEVGNVLNENNEVIGEHDGALLYTIGERHGFRVSNQSPDQEILYVINRNVDENTITVSKNKPEVKSDSIAINLKDINLTSDDNELNGEYEASFRYRQKPVKVKLEISGKTGIITPTQDAEKVSSGQSVVFYDKDVCLGGGVIVK